MSRRRLRPDEFVATWRRLKYVLRGERRRIGKALGLAIAATLLELARPWPVKWVIDHVIQGGDALTGSGIAIVVAVAFAAFAIPAAIGVTRYRVALEAGKVGRKATVRLRRDLFDRIHRMSLTEHDRRYSGDLIVRLMGDVNMVRDLLLGSWLTVVSQGLALIGAAVALLLVDWRLFIMALPPLPLLWLSTRTTTRKVKEVTRTQRRREGAIASFAAESLGNIATVKAFTAEDRAIDRFAHQAGTAERASLKAIRYAAKMQATTEVLTGIGVGLVLGVGALFTLAGRISPGELIVVMSYTRMMYKPVRKLTGEGAKLGKAGACARRVIDVLDLPPEDPGVGLVATRLDGDVAFQAVRHAYPDGRRSLQGLNARIPAGSLVAITGPNGAGKSTLLDLLLRLREPTSGTISIGNVPIKRYRIDSYRSRIAFVPQQLSLFGGTVAENIEFGRPGATHDDVAAAAAAALFDEAVAELPDGYDTTLGEGGASLSGGQARRLMLARAAIRDASLLLLDEPLTGLDPDVRPVVAAAIKSVANGRTTFVVHHGDLDELDPDIELRMRNGRGVVLHRRRRAVAP